MFNAYSLLFLVFGAGVGATMAWLYWKSKSSEVGARLQHLEEERTAMQAKLAVQDEEVRALLQKNAKLENAEENIVKQFENLANRIFEEKTDRFKKESQEGIGQMLSPLKEKLNEFQKKVDHSFGEQIKEQVSLKAEIKNIISVNEQMSQQAENLTKALKGDKKAQGNWGEVMLEKILEDSGLRKGVDYVVQGAGMKLKHVESGATSKPDVVIHLPDDKHIIVDAKVSLTGYERFCAAETPEERAEYLKQHLLSVRKHVKDLEDRRYQDTDMLGTPDFVLMFMPIEGAYSLAVQEDLNLHRDAWEKKVVIVCPATLFATLKTIASVWQMELQNRNAQEIARQGGALYDKVAGFVADMEDIGKKIVSTQKAYDSAFNKLSSGRGNILKRAQDLEALGAKSSKKLPARLLEGDVDADEGEEPLRKEAG